MQARQEAERTIFLVSPRSPIKLAVGSKGLGAPMALGVVGSTAEKVRNEAGFEKEVAIRIVDEDLDQRVDAKAGDLVLATSFSLTAKRVKSLTQEVNDRGGYVVAGGIHATVDPEDFTRAGAISFRGEAGNSTVFSRLLNQYLHKGVLERGQVVDSEGVADPKSISLVGLPVSKKIYEELDRNRFTHITFASVGCPYQCAFCTVMGGRVVRPRPVEEIEAEILTRGLDVSGFTLADSHLGAAGFPYLYSLLDRLAGINIPRAWHSEITIDCLGRGGNRLLKALRDAQCHRLFVGFESPNTDSLVGVGKKHNLKYGLEEVREIVRRAHEQGIKITGLFIVGLLQDTVPSIRSIEKFINHTQLDGANISLLTTFPGSKIWDDFVRDKLFDPETLDTDHLDFRHLNFNHPLGNELLISEYDRLCKRVFSSGRVLSRSVRQFFMSWKTHLPASFERDLRNSFGTELVWADLHRGLKLTRGADRVINGWKQLLGAEN